MTEQVCFKPVKTFMEQYKAIIPYIDSDGSRFFDWVFTARGCALLDTHTTHYRSGNEVLEDNTRRFTTKMVAALVPSLETIGNNHGGVTDLKKTEYFSESVYRVIVYKDEVPYFIMSVGVTIEEVFVVVVSDEKTSNDTIKLVRERIFTPDAIEINKLVGFSESGPIIHPSTISHEDEELLTGRMEFYPFINKWSSISDLAEKFSASRASTLILIGPPGTGKTTLLRTLQLLMKRKHNYLVVGDQAISNPAMTPWLHTLPKGSLVVFEDSDSLCAKRKEGNTQMASLLQIADGVVREKTKFIISTNLPNLNVVDEALIRPGRSYAVIEFRELTIEEANLARAAIDLPPIETDKTKLSLSYALNYSEQEPPKGSFGFM